MPDRRLARISLLLVVSLAPALLAGCASRPALIEPSPAEPAAATRRPDHQARPRT